MAAQGTLESIAIAVARFFQPLADELRAGRIRTLLAELGMEFPPELETKTAFINELTKTATEAGRLPECVTKLITAIDNEQFDEIASKGITLFGTVRTLVEGFDTISDELKNISGSLPGVSAADVNAFANELPWNLLDYLLVTSIESTPGVVEALEFMDAVERTEHTSGDFSFTRRRIKLDQFMNFVTEPGKQLEALYGWGKPSFDGVVLLRTLERLLSGSGVPAIFDPAAVPPVLDMIFLEASPKTDINPKGLRLELLDKIVVDSEPFAMDEWRIRFVLNVELGTGTELIVQPDGKTTLVPPSGNVEGEAFFEWVAGNPSGEPYLVLGQPGGSRLSVTELSIKPGVGFRWDNVAEKGEGDFQIAGGLRGGKIVIDFSEGDGFLSQILSNVGLESDFDVGFGYSSRDGLFFTGSAELQIQLPVHVDLGPIGIRALTIGVGIDGDAIPISLSLDINANLGPLQAAVEQIGVTADLSFPGDRKGNLGPVDLDIGFKPPTGVGLSVDAGAVKGGGFLRFDRERGEYDGVLELVFSEWIALKAIGLITTKLPDGSKGFSLLIIITVEFGSGFQLGFGFTLLGVGGLLGLHRITNIEPLAEGVRTGATESVMFPVDVIANASRIISDLKRFFPPRQEIFLVGPMAKIGWGTPTLVSVQLGVILEFPSVNITILGVIKVVLPDEKADVLRLQVNFIGRLEPSNKLLWFYAELFDSRVLFITLEGGFGLLINWGDNANFVVSVGGFHPRYSPPPLPFPEPPRIAVSILNTSFAKVRIEGYFAVTSNSVQFGARAELYFGVSAFRIEGSLGFDALFQFDPFFFSFSVSVSLSVKVFGVGLFSVGFSGLLEGPTPWHIEGKGKIRILFFKIKVPFKHTWGQSQDTRLDPIEVFPLLETEFNALTNWEARLPASSSNLLVSLRKLGESSADQLVLHPVGKLRVSQRKVPIEFKLAKVGNKRPSDVDRVDVSVALTGGGDLSVSKVRDRFALGQFEDLDASARMSRPAFEPLQSGREIAVAGAQMKTSRAVRRVIRYETIIIDNFFKRHVKRFFNFFATGYALVNEILFAHFLKGNAVSQSKLSRHYKKRLQPFDEVIQIQPQRYSVAFNSDNRPLDAGAMTFESRAEAEQFLTGQVESNAALGQRLHVIPNTELNIAA